MAVEKITREEAERIKAEQQNKQLLAVMRELVSRPDEQWKNEIIQKLGKELQAVAAAVAKIPQPTLTSPEVQVTVDNAALVAELQKMIVQFNQKLTGLDKRLDQLIDRPDMEMTFTRNGNGYINSPIMFKAVK